MFRLTLIFVILSGTILLSMSTSVQANIGGDSKYLLLKQLLGLKKVHSTSAAFNPEPEWYGSESKFHYPGEQGGGDNVIVSGPSTPNVIGGTGSERGDETLRFYGIMLQNYQPYYTQQHQQGQQQKQQEEVFMFPGQQQEQLVQGGVGGNVDQSSIYASIQQQKHRQGMSYSGEGVVSGSGGSSIGYSGSGIQVDYDRFSSIQSRAYAPYTQQQQQQQQGTLYSMSNEDMAMLNSQGFVRAIGGGSGGGGSASMNRLSDAAVQQLNTNDQTSQFLDVMIKNYEPYSGGGSGIVSGSSSASYGSQFKYPGGF